MFSDWDNLVQTVLAYWATLQAKPEWALGAAMLAIGGFAVKTLKPVAALDKWNRARRGQALASSIAAKTHVQSFSDADIVGATANYVEPDCSNVDPANERDIRRVVGVRDLRQKVGRVAVGALVVQRLKRARSILSKLAKESSMRLTQMQVSRRGRDHRSSLRTHWVT